MRYLWYAMYGFVTTLAIYALFFRPARVVESPPQEPTPPPAVVQEAPEADVQIALILDTSSSMDGLVAQARAQIWEMVAEMQTDSNGNEKTVAVALYQYGNNRLAKSEGYIQQLTPLTTNLDEVTLKLHSLSTTGGKEYAPLAISRAVEELEWSDDDGVERLIVIAGNEGFSQGRLSPKDALQAAERLDIRVMPIYCANRGATRSAVSSWKYAAELANTDFQSIDPDQAIAQSESPYDKLIIEKYRKLEETRVYAAGSEVQAARSKKAEGYLAPKAAVDRAVVNSRQAPSFDLVKQYKSGKSIAPTALPQALRSKSKDEQVQYLEARSKARETLQREIEELNQQRSAHLAQKRNRRAGSAPASLGSAFRNNVNK